MDLGNILSRGTQVGLLSCEPCNYSQAKGPRNFTRQQGFLGVFKTFIISESIMHIKVRLFFQLHFVLRGILDLENTPPSYMTAEIFTLNISKVCRG